MYAVSELPEMLRKERTAQGHRQEDVARAAGISREALSRYENYRLDLRLASAAALFAALGQRLVFGLEPLPDPEAESDTD